MMSLKKILLAGCISLSGLMAASADRNSRIMTLNDQIINILSGSEGFMVGVPSQNELQTAAFITMHAGFTNLGNESWINHIITQQHNSISHAVAIDVGNGHDDDRAMGPQTTKIINHFRDLLILYLVFSNKNLDGAFILAQIQAINTVYGDDLIEQLHSALTDLTAASIRDILNAYHAPQILGYFSDPATRLTPDVRSDYMLAIRHAPYAATPARSLVSAAVGAGGIGGEAARRAAELAARGGHVRAEAMAGAVVPNRTGR